MLEENDHSADEDLSDTDGNERILFIYLTKRAVLLTFVSTISVTLAWPMIRSD